MHTRHMKDIRILHIPDDIHMEFKLLCIRRNSSMTEEIIKFMRKEVEKANKKSN